MEELMMKINKKSVDNKTMDLAKDLVQLYSDFDWYDFADAYGTADGENWDQAISDTYDSLIHTKPSVSEELREMIEELEFDLEDEYDEDIASLRDDAVKLRERVEAL